MYSTKLLTREDYENFEIVYDDFCAKAKKEYNKAHPYEIHTIRKHRH